MGIEREPGQRQRQLEFALSGEGTVKFLRGGYGCGQNFNARLAALDGFGTSFVVVSDSDLRFHRFDHVHRKVMTEVGTAPRTPGARRGRVPPWVGKGGSEEQRPRRECRRVRPRRVCALSEATQCALSEPRVRSCPPAQIPEGTAASSEALHRR